MASTAFAVMKFFVVVIPKIGTSSLPGTGALLLSVVYVNFADDLSMLDLFILAVIGKPDSGFGGPNKAPSFLTTSPAPYNFVVP